MRRGITSAVGLTVLAGLLLGCSESEEPPPGEELDAQIVMLENDPTLPLTPPAVSAQPVDPGLMAGWIATESDADDAEPRDPNSGELPEAEDGKSYVFLTSGTRCLPAQDASLWRDGDALEVVLDVPDEEDVNCESPNRVHVQFAVDSDLVEGVTAVDGDGIMSPTGPAESVAEVMVGKLFDDRIELTSVEPVEVTSAEDGEPILSALADADGAENLDEVEAVLTESVPDGMRRFAFLLRGCPGDESVLAVAPGLVSAERTGPGQSGCSEAEQFLLTVFDVPSDTVTPDTRPALYRP